MAHVSDVVCSFSSPIVHDGEMPWTPTVKDRGTRQAISGRRVIPKTTSGSQSGEPKTKSTMITSEDEVEDD